MGDPLHEYRRKRDPTRTPEPVPREAPEPSSGSAREAPGPSSGSARGSGGRGRTNPGHGDRFVIQQHHARRLHWDLRLERDGVLASWAVPRGLPREPGRSHLAVHTEDHPLEYLDFHGTIPAGEYGGGRMTVFDRGSYACEKWRDDEVLVVLHGERVSGRYVLFRATRATGRGLGGRGVASGTRAGATGGTGPDRAGGRRAADGSDPGRDWMVRRLDPAPPGWLPMPEVIRPMLPTHAAALPPDDEAWGYEMRWDGIRAIGYVAGGRLRLMSDGDTDVTSAYPQLRELAEELAPTEVVLDGELVAFDEAGRVRPAVPRPSGRRASRTQRPQYLIFDLLWLEGSASVDLPYAQRRELLDGLALSGGHWQTPPYFPGGGRYALAASREQGLAGLVAKRLDSGYLPGRRSRRWLTVDG